MLPDVDPLPGTEAQLPTGYRHAQVDRRQCRPDMRRHVIVALDGVGEECIPVWHQAREEPLEVATDVGVGVLLNQQ